MAQTYYNYAERNAESQINWAEIGRSMTDTLREEAQLREQKKAALDEATRKTSEALANAPVGSLDSANKLTLGLADQSQEQLLMSQRLLKSGLLKPKDYLLVKQNLNDNVKGVYDLAKNYNAIHERLMKGIEDGTISESSVQIAQMAEGIARLENMGTIVNPTDGTVTLGKLVKGTDGVVSVSTDPNEQFTVNQMKAIFSREYKRYQLNDETKKIVDTIGDFVEEIREDIATNGYDFDTWEKTTDKKRRSDYQEIEDLNVEAILENPLQTMSVLVDWSDGNYSITFNEDEFKKDTTGKKIYIDKNDGIPQFKPAQIKEAGDAIRTSMRGAIAEGLEVTKADRRPMPPKPSQAEKQEQENIKEAQEAVRQMYNLYAGQTAGDVGAAESYFLGRNNFSSINKENAIVIDATGQQRELKFFAPDGTALTFEQFFDANKNTLAPGLPVDKVDISGFTGDYSAVLGGGAVTTPPVDPVEAGRQTVIADLDAKLTVDLFTDTDDVKVIENIASIVAPYGIIVRETNDTDDSIDMFYQGTKITPDGGIRTDEGTPQSRMVTIKNLILGGIPDKKFAQQGTVMKQY